MKQVLFVCTGNICRSPTAEGVARHYIETSGLSGYIKVDSAGTHGYHAGEAPDPRARKAAAARGYDLSALRARKLETGDYIRFDLLVGMDNGHIEWMRNTCPPVYHPKIVSFMHYAQRHDYSEVPDPYYGGPASFEVVLDLCEDGVHGLIQQLRLEA